MNPILKIHKQTIASGLEWKPCVGCDNRFVFGEIITALSREDGCNVNYWYCSKCFEQWWFSPLPVPVPAEYDFCMVVIKEGKVQVCPKRMSQEGYMKRSPQHELATVGLINRKSKIINE